MAEPLAYRDRMRESQNTESRRVAAAGFAGTAVRFGLVGLLKTVLDFATFNLVIVVWHLPPVYNLAMAQHQVHIVGHLLMMAASVILWWPVLSPVSELPRAPYPIQLLYLFVVGLPMVMVAILISMADGMLYPYYAAAPRVWPWLTPHADQHLGGLIMWIPGGLVFLLAVSVIFFRWQGAGGDDLALREVEHELRTGVGR